MRLRDLDARFIQHLERDGQRLERAVDTLAEAHGIFFDCPKCYVTNGGPVGTHGVVVTFADRGVPDHLGSHDSSGRPSRWQVSGTGLDDLSTQPSIWLRGAPCEWHGYITNGDAT